MIDQAARLRGMMETRLTRMSEPATPEPVRPSARVIAVTSGKGGVGKSHIALNLAIGLTRQHSRVCVIDANLGLANIDLLCGLNGYWNLSHVVTGARRLPEIMLDGPEGIHVISGASGLTDIADCTPDAQQDILAQLNELETNHDYLVIDTGTGIHQTVRGFVAAADLALIVTTPEPTSIADAYATVKSLSTAPPPQLMVVVNQAESARQAQNIIDRMKRTAGMFLQTDIAVGGHIPSDRHVVDAVIRRTPLLIDSPRCAAADAIEKLARRVKSATAGQPARGRFFARIPARKQRHVG